MKKDLSKILRCKIIIEEIEKGYYPSLKDLQHKIEQMGEYDERFRDVSERTLENDKKDIRDIFKIYIEYDRNQQGYYIDTEISDTNVLPVLDAINLYYIVQNAPDAMKYIRFSPRKATGSELFLTLLKAIEHHKKVEFVYSQYEKNEITKRTVKPLGLKEYKGFWYLLAKDDKGIKTFGLDRIEGLSVTSNSFQYPTDFSMDKFYENCFGIVRFPNTNPEKIYIKASPIKTAYYKANPLHHSQQIVKDGDEYSVFSIFVYRTYDLEQEIRSHGDEVTFVTEQDLLAL